MSNFAYVRAFGVWNTLTDLHSLEMQQIDQNLFKAPNFADGGTYAPSGVVTVGGAGVTLTLVGANIVPSGGTITVQSGAALALASGSGASFGGTSTYLSTSVTNHNSGAAGHWLNGSILHIDSGAQLDVTGDLFLNAGSFVDIEGTVSFGSGAALTVNCASDFAGAATFDAGVTITAGNFAVLGGVTSLGGTNHIVGVTTISGPTSVTTAVALTGAGRTVRQAVVGAASGGGTADPAVASTYYFASVTADQTYTIVNTSAQDGDELEFWTESTTNSVSVHDHLGTPIQSIKNAAGNFCWIKVKRILGNWKLVGITKL